ncbi:hypothetical protein DET59_101242 [Rossellomorea aquimaris]|uniref:Uncharacterized protein n=1 Tax=Rossellomorea aquimaris TaxID=189382 RepID=A0A366EZV2_9BACI|nr:hypothetical protein DET59_101242 [Rossellomorea aquimaris]
MIERKLVPRLGTGFLFWISPENTLIINARYTFSKKIIG